mgnify:CR=1 FL=1
MLHAIRGLHQNSYDAVFYRSQGIFVRHLAIEIIFVNSPFHMILNLRDLEMGEHSSFSTSSSRKFGF